MLLRWGQPEFVWYAAYGSNLRQERFRCYIEGGSIDGNVRQYEPCVDTTPPSQILHLTIPYQLFFAGESKAWTGGVAFIKPDPASLARAHSRAYQISFEQFRHLVRQENQASHLPILPIREAIAQGSSIIPGLAGKYDQLIYLGHRGPHPVLTFTSSVPAATNPPASAYLRQIITGLQELRHGPHDIVSYLKSAPGMAGHYSQVQLHALLRETMAIA